VVECRNTLLHKGIELQQGIATKKLSHARVSTQGQNAAVQWRAFKQEA